MFVSMNLIWVFIFGVILDVKYCVGVLIIYNCLMLVNLGVLNEDGLDSKFF